MLFEETQWNWKKKNLNLGNWKKNEEYKEERIGQKENGIEDVVFQNGIKKRKNGTFLKREKRQQWTDQNNYQSINSEVIERILTENYFFPEVKEDRNDRQEKIVWREERTFVGDNARGTSRKERWSVWRSEESKRWERRME